MKLRACFVVSFALAVVCFTVAQTAAPNSSVASTQVPRFIKFSGVEKDDTQKHLAGVVGVTFLCTKISKVAVRYGLRHRTSRLTRLDTTP